MAASDSFLIRGHCPAPSGQHAHVAGVPRPPPLPCPVHGRPVAAICATCGIRRIGICASLGDHEIRDLEAIMSHRRLGPRQSLVLEGDTAEYAYNVISGGLKVFKSLPDGRTQMVGFLLPGDFLGLPPRGRYAYSTDTLGPTELCQFPRSALLALFDKHASLQEQVLTVVHDELAAAQEHMLLLGRKHATERVGSFLLSLLRRTERLGGATDPLFIPLHRDEIADYLGVTLETVSRSFTQLRNEGVIRLEKSHLVSIADLDRLAAIAETV